jgi:hypothetical protein
MNKFVTKTIFYNFRLNKGQPLDDRSQISSLTNIAAELVPEERYAGMLFWVQDIELFYTFHADLATPVSFRDAIVTSDKKGFVVPADDYANLLVRLNAINPVIGQQILIMPLGVTFQYDGVSWNYAFGEYIVDTDETFLSIPVSLRERAATVILGLDDKIILSDGTLSDVVITGSVMPIDPEEGRYYSINGVLYFFLGGVAFKIGKNDYVATNVTLGIGDTLITHNLNSPYVRSIFWINTTNALVQPQQDFVDADKITINSRVVVTGTILVSSLI